MKPPPLRKLRHHELETIAAREGARVEYDPVRGYANRADLIRAIEAHRAGAAPAPHTPR
jgi:hypothetical protein